jgi:hypothetical protein
VVRFCEHSNVLLCSLKGRAFLTGGGWGDTESMLAIIWPIIPALVMMSVE